MTPTERVADTARFYELLGHLETALGGTRTLAGCDGHMGWPLRGVYFFFEPGERRSQSGLGARVVRVGTHGLTPYSQTNLWSRLALHRGPARDGVGRHRNSIFRLLVGSALAGRGDCERPASWGGEWSLAVAARELGTTTDAIKDSEAALERRVSATIGAMPFLWLAVPDAAGRHSARGYIERNAIALLSSARGAVVDAPSPTWLGRHSDRRLIRASGLWNTNHVLDPYDPGFLDTLDAAIEGATGDAPSGRGGP